MLVYKRFVDSIQFVMLSLKWCFVLIVSSFNFSSQSVSKSSRHGSLDYFVEVLNSHNKTLESWRLPNGSLNDYESLIELLGSWIMSELPFPLEVVTAPVERDVDCKASQYSAVLTGRQLPNPRIIVDFIPFGYDVEKLEIRFYELYDIVDVFVIYESTRTQSALRKPLFYTSVKNTTRFRKWSDKVIHLKGDDIELKDFIHETVSWKDDFALEKSMRSEMIRKFNQLDASNGTLKKYIVKNMKLAYGIQNDGDEIPNREALAHFKQCATRKKVQRVYFPCMSFKKNFQWLQRTFDLQCMEGGNVNNRTAELKSFQWRPGPFTWPLSSMIRVGSTGRLHEDRLLEKFCTDHMGLGAAVHMSSVAEPGEYLLKRCGVIEQHHQGALSDELVRAGRKGKIRPRMVADSLLIPWCSDSNPALHISEGVRSTEAREIVLSSIPWVVRYNPLSYPFLMPAPPLEDYRRHLRRVLNLTDEDKLPVKKNRRKGRGRGRGKRGREQHEDSDRKSRSGASSGGGSGKKRTSKSSRSRSSRSDASSRKRLKSRIDDDDEIRVGNKKNREKKNFLKERMNHVRSQIDQQDRLSDQNCTIDERLDVTGSSIEATKTLEASEATVVATAILKDAKLPLGSMSVRHRRQLLDLLESVEYAMEGGATVLQGASSGFAHYCGLPEWAKLCSKYKNTGY